MRNIKIENTEYLDCFEKVGASYSFDPYYAELDSENIEKISNLQLARNIADYIVKNIAYLEEEGVIDLEEITDGRGIIHRRIFLNLLKREKFLFLKNYKESTIKRLKQNIESRGYSFSQIIDSYKEKIDERDKKIKKLEDIIMTEWCLTDPKQIYDKEV